EPALRTLRLAARNHLRIRARVLQRSLVPAERALVDHRAHEVAEVARVAHANVADHCRNAVAHFGPERTRHVDPARCRTLLTLELESAAHDRNCQRLRIGRRMRNDEVLAARFANDARIATVTTHVAADRLPHG